MNKETKKKSIKQQVSSQINSNAITTDIEKCIRAGYDNILDLYGLSITKGKALDIEKLCKERKVSYQKLKKYYFEKNGKKLQKINYNEKSREGLEKFHAKVKKAQIAYNNGSATQEQIELVVNEKKRLEKAAKTREMNKGLKSGIKGLKIQDNPIVEEPESKESLKKYRQSLNKYKGGSNNYGKEGFTKEEMEILRKEALSEEE